MVGRRAAPSNGLCKMAEDICLSQTHSHRGVSKYRPQQGESVNGSANRLQFIRSYAVIWITMLILELIHEANVTITWKTVANLELIHATNAPT